MAPNTTMSRTITTSRTALAACLAAACAFAAPAAASVSDFRLPDPSAQQQQQPDRQGPVAPDVPESRVRPTPTPTAARPAADASPVVVPPVLDQPAARQPTRAVPPPVTSPRPGQAPAPTAASTADSASGDPALPADGTITPAPLPASSAPTVASDTEGETSWWLWTLGALLAFGALGFAAWAWWQRRAAAGPVAVPQVERPRLAPSPAQGAAAPAPAAPAAEPLQITLEPLRLSLTLINATLSYRLEVANRGASPLEDLRIGADMISAHSSMSREQQLAGPGIGAAPQQRIARLEPGDSQVVEGEFRVPFSQIVPIRQGNAALLLPLARFRLEAAGTSAVVRTFVVGQPGQGTGLQPFRLDLGPRIYPRLSQRAFA